MDPYPSSLQPEALMVHMRAICQGIGPRPSTSHQESQAADYVEKTLRHWGMTDIKRQLFKSRNSYGWATVPCFAVGLLASIFAAVGSRWGKLISSVLLLGSARTFRRSVLAMPPFFRRWISRWTSRNVIVNVPAKDKARQTVYLVGHLDSQKQRFQFPPSNANVMKAEASLPIVLGVLGSLSSLVAAAFKPRKTPWWIWPLGAAYVWGLCGGLYDETQPYIEGANDNATAVSVLLGIAQALKHRPLQHTDVVLLFTGCEEVGCVGMARYLEQYSPPRDNTLWIDIEMVGTGDLCYVTQHGISYFTSYVPHPEIVGIAKEVAEKHPYLGVKGKEMVIIEEIATLRREKYKAVCVAGYNEEGALPNWHRLSDNLDNIEPETLSRAARYTWEIVNEIDNRSKTGGDL
jgi:hypothetical protein